MATNPIIGIALGGGGARGFAHLGVLRVLREHGIEAQIVTGTSIGALVGAAYACDVTERFERVATNIRVRDILSLLSPAWTARGLFSGKNVLQMLSDLLPVSRIEEMPRRFATVATDLQHSELVTFTEGDLEHALRASMAVPGAFTPVVDEGRILVDGGILEPIPVQAARDLGAQIVIAVDLFHADGHASLRNRRPFFTPAPGRLHPYLSRLGLGSTRKTEAASLELRTIFDVMVRTLAVSQAHLSRMNLERCPADVLITPEVGDTGVADFHRASEVSGAGERAALAVLPQIKKVVSG